MKFRFELIRHGTTAANDNSLYCGHTDLPLNEGGIAGIEAIKQAGKYNLADIYFTSGLKRANMTLNIIAGDVQYEVIEGFKECNFGIFEGYTHDELMVNEHKDFYNAWITDETGTYIPPQGESTVGFNERVDKAIIELFDKIAEKNPGSAMMVSHGGVIARFVFKYMDSSLNMYEAMPNRGEGFSMNIDYTDGVITVEDYYKITL